MLFFPSAPKRMALRPLLALSSFSVLFSFLYTVSSAAPTSSPLGPTIEAYWQLSAGSSVSSSPSITEDGSTIVFTSDGGIVYAGDIANQTIAWQTTMPTVQFGTPAAPALYEPAGLVISCSVSQCVGLSLRNGSIVWARNNTAAPANYTGPRCAARRPLGDSFTYS